MYPNLHLTNLSSHYSLCMGWRAPGGMHLGLAAKYLKLEKLSLLLVISHAMGKLCAISIMSTPDLIFLQNQKTLQSLKSSQLFTLPIWLRHLCLGYTGFLHPFSVNSIVFCCMFQQAEYRGTDLFYFTAHGSSISPLSS